MKLKNIKFNNNKILNNLDVDFCDSNGDIEIGNFKKSKRNLSNSI